MCALVLVAVVILYLCFGREHKPRFTGAYLRRDSARDLHPALVGRLWRWNRESGDDFTVSVMNLARQGAVKLARGSYPDGAGAPMDDFRLTRDDAKAAELSDPIDQVTMEVLFDEFAKGTGALWFAAIRKFGEDEPSSFVAAMGRWQHRLTEEVARRDFFDRRSMKLRTAVFVVALVLAIAAAANFLTSGGLVSTVAFAVTAAVLVVMGNAMPRRTVAGNEVAARCKAARNYVRDLAAFGGEPASAGDEPSAAHAGDGALSARGPLRLCGLMPPCELTKAAQAPIPAQSPTTRARLCFYMRTCSASLGRISRPQPSACLPMARRSRILSPHGSCEESLLRQRSMRSPRRRCSSPPLARLFRRRWRRRCRLLARRYPRRMPG